MSVSVDSPADPPVNELARLLEHPAIWRGRSAARTETLPTGYPALDASLPGKGWPRTGLIEILVPRFGVGELNLLLPTLAALTRRPMARWCVWISPPLEPYAPALAAHGVILDRMLVVRAPEALWAFEQSVGSGAGDVVLAWSARGPGAREVRRLQLAAERGKTLGVLFRPQRAARESSPAILRLSVEPVGSRGVRLTLLKSRGGGRGSIELAFTSGCPTVGS
jgi:hypothetical protein